METINNFNDGFYRNKRVFVTGHTGFKGSWLCKILINEGAIVTGYSLPAKTNPNLFDLSCIEEQMVSVIGDIRDFDALFSAFQKANPEIVFHLAAQPIVLDSYKNPRYTYETNVIGTVNILECIRLCDGVKSVINVTTDKVYNNKEWAWGYRESDELCGYDPYSNSKSCSELVTSSYKRSFLADKGIAVSAMRAGNVIGGGDFAPDRIIPDCVRSAANNEPVILRNPLSTRPFQHVLEPLSAYLMVARMQYQDIKFAGEFNIGPDDCDCITAGEITAIFAKHWGNGFECVQRKVDGPHEANFLKLDCSKIKSQFGWRPRWNIETAVEKTIEFYKIYFADGDIAECMDKQISEFNVMNMKNE